MVLGKVSDFLIKHQRLLTYLSTFAALMLLMRLVYDDVLVDHDNPIVLAIFIGILVLWTLASYLNRRQHMLSHFILQSSKLINVYAVDLDYRFIAVNKNDIRLMEEIFYFTPKIGDFPMNYLNSEDAARLKANVDRAKKGETFIFMDTIKTDLDAFSENVFCFSPSGEVISLTEGSTPVDFAYAIHSAVGNTMVGARVNNRIVNFDYVIKNGDRVEIVTSQNSRGPSRDWLKFVKTSQAKSKINQWYKKINKEENIVRGKELLEKEAKRKGYNISDLLFPKAMAAVQERYSFKDWESVCAAVGHGGLKEGQVINKLNEEYKAEVKRNKTAQELLREQEEAIKAHIESETAAQQAAQKRKSKSGIYVHGVGDIEVRFSKCCSPVPGDEIVGFVTRGRGVSIHRTDCINIINLSEEERARLLEAEWTIDRASGSGRFKADIRIFADDRDGLTLDILKVVIDEGLSVINVNGRSLKNGTAVVDLSLKISGTEQLEILCKKIMNISGVDDIERVNS